MLINAPKLGIPVGFRELEKGEVLMVGDQYSGNLEKWDLVEGWAGRKYKIDVLQNPQYVCIRAIGLKKNKPKKINVFCANITEKQYYVLNKLIRNHKVYYRDYMYNSDYYKNFYVITENYGNGDNAIGFTPEPMNNNYFKECKLVTFNEVLEILGDFNPDELKKKLFLTCDISIKLKEYA